jgi:hypothetical protein
MTLGIHFVISLNVSCFGDCQIHAAMTVVCKEHRLCTAITIFIAEQAERREP